MRFSSPLCILELAVTMKHVCDWSHRFKLAEVAFPTFVNPETPYVSALILSTKRPWLDPAICRLQLRFKCFLFDSVSVSSPQNHCQFFQVHTGQGQRHWMIYLLVSWKQFTFDNVTLPPLFCRVNTPGVYLRLKTDVMFISFRKSKYSWIIYHHVQKSLPTS